MSRYELWLDESGNFADEQSKKTHHQMASLIGGILVPETVNQSSILGMLDSNIDNHANTMSESKKDYVLPILERVKELGCKEVFFENTTYEDDSSGNRSLYLRIMAEGLVQLLQYLHITDDDVKLNVIIARRQDVSNPQRHIITAEEYKEALERCINQKSNEHRLFFNSSSALSYEVEIAAITPKLQVADFACNTRLTRNSHVFSDVKDRVNALYDGAYIFALYELTSESYIKMCLSRGYIAKAIMELYTSMDDMDHERQLDIIFSRVSKTSYRILKTQIKKCTSDLVALISGQSDYEKAEEMLKNIQAELVPRMMELGENFCEFNFNVLITIADMYLREGDIVAAKETLVKAELAQTQMGNRMENILSFYQLAEKKAVYYVDSFAYEDAVGLMRRACDTFENIIAVVNEDDNLVMRFPDIKSEYYGDALCMLIYAMMFQQKNSPELYDELVRLSDIALKQYPNNEGELERHRQYRSHIEAVQGKPDIGLRWLIQAKTYKWEELTEENIIGFIDSLCESEEKISCQYYLMYYLEILNIAYEKDITLWTNMRNALIKQKKLLRLVDSDDNTVLFSNTVDLSHAYEPDTKIIYHPMEIVWFEYAKYLISCGKDSTKKGEAYLKKLVKLCKRYPNYATMRITSLSIDAYRIHYYIDVEKKTNFISEVKKVVDECDSLLECIEEQKTRMYISYIKELVQEGKYKEAADMLAY